MGKQSGAAGTEVENLAIKCLRKINNDNKNILETGSCSPCTLHCTPFPLNNWTAPFSLAGAVRHYDTAPPCLNIVSTISLIASSQRVRGHILPTFVFHSTQSHMEHIGGLFHFIKPRSSCEYGICLLFYFNKGLSLSNY